MQTRAWVISLVVGGLENLRPPHGPCPTYPPSSEHHFSDFDAALGPTAPCEGSSMGGASHGLPRGGEGRAATPCSQLVKAWARRQASVTSAGRRPRSPTGNPMLRACRALAPTA